MGPTNSLVHVYAPGLMLVTNPSSARDQLQSPIADEPKPPSVTLGRYCRAADDPFSSEMVGRKKEGSSHVLRVVQDLVAGNSSTRASGESARNRSAGNVISGQNEPASNVADGLGTRIEDLALASNAQGHGNGKADEPGSSRTTPGIKDATEKRGPAG